MRVLEADLDRIRLTVRRPARAEAVTILVGMAVLALGPLGWFSVVSSELAEVEAALAEAPPEPLPCTWETLRTIEACTELAADLLELPSLADVYLVRRRHHRAELLPELFDAPPPVVAPLPDPFDHLVDDDARRRLVGHVIRDAGLPVEDESPTGWMGRDPVLGVPLGSRLPDDRSVLAHAEDHASEQSELARVADSAAVLVETGMIRETTEGHYVVTSDEMRAHLASLAARDVLDFAELRTAALEVLVDRQHATATHEHRSHQVELEGRAAAWRVRRSGGIPVLVGAWALAAALVMPLSWCFRRRITITMDLHALTLGDVRLLWESLDELIWTNQHVTWHVEGGTKGRVGELQLSDGEVRMLQRTSHAVWLRDRGGPPHGALRAIRQLVENAPRGDD